MANTRVSYSNSPLCG